MDNKDYTINIETDDWKLHCFLDWNPKNHDEKCPSCRGKGEIGIVMPDKPTDKPKPPEPAPNDKPDRNAKPATSPIKYIRENYDSEIPRAIREHMRRAWWGFFNLPDPEKETNKEKD